MAQGLLGSATLPGGGGSPPVVAYTVPAGISHAVVHITISLSGSIGTNQSNGSVSVTVNGTPVLTQSASISSTNFSFFSNAVSMMLSPGNVVRITGSPTDAVYCTVTGYEVP